MKDKRENSRIYVFWPLIVIAYCIWHSLDCRFDIAYVTGYLRFDSALTTAHYSTQIRVLRYLNKAQSYGIHCKSNSLEGLVAFVDADQAGDKQNKKSDTSYALKLFGSIVSASLVKQKSVATSTLKAKYITLAKVVKKVIWFQRLLKEIGLDQKTVTINIDNKGAIDYAKNAQFSQRTKHINIKHYFIRDHLNKEEIKLAYI